tara:strand:- start:2071 stop:2427 length:357 start_codon:yes stop_codon:yes gene_type:complete
MKKILIFICLSFLISAPSFSLTADKYLINRNSDDSEITTMLKVYINGVGHANFWTSAVSGALNKKLFCPPGNWSPNVNDFLSYIDAEIVHQKNKNSYNKEDQVEFYMATYLVRTYPCE